MISKRHANRSIRPLLVSLLATVCIFAACAAPPEASATPLAPDALLTRETIVTRLWDLAGQPACDVPDGFADTDAVSDWAREAVRWAKNSGLLDTIAADGEFQPRGEATTLDCALLLMSFLKWKGRPTVSPGTEGDFKKLEVSFSGHTYAATLENNSSAQAFAALLQDGPLTISAHDYGNFEKVGDLGSALPRNDETITTSPGDLILYQGDQITVYYGENTWNFTRLGRIDDPTGLEEALGDGDVDITFSLAKETGAADAAGNFDLDARAVRLNSGYFMPLNGLGTYSLHGETCVDAVKSALASGVRLFDTASAYGNEEEVGKALREGMEELGINREDIFVTTKIYPGSEMANPEKSIQACLDRLDLGYVDLMLLHHPDANDVAAYQAMERFVDSGQIRSVGLSNWYVEELESFLPQVETTPALIQNEIHPYYQENDVIPYIQDLGIVMEGWYPLGGRGHTQELLSDETIISIAEAHDVSPAQAILRWNLQKGVVVIPGSSNPDHILENTQLYDFELTDEEMARINALDRNEKHDWY